MILATFRPEGTGKAGFPLVVVKNELKLHRPCKVLPQDYFSETTPTLAVAFHAGSDYDLLYGT